MASNTSPSLKSYRSASTRTTPGPRSHRPRRRPDSLAVCARVSSGIYRLQARKTQCLGAGQGSLWPPFQRSWGPFVKTQRNPQGEGACRQRPSLTPVPWSPSSTAATSTTNGPAPSSRILKASCSQPSPYLPKYPICSTSASPLRSILFAGLPPAPWNWSTFPARTWRASSS